MHIRNPVEWGVDQLRSAGHAIEGVGRARYGVQRSAGDPADRGRRP